MEKIPNYSCIKCGKYLHQHQLPVWELYKYPESASLPRQSDPSELATEIPWPGEANLPEKSCAARRNNMEIMSSTLVELDRDICQQISEIPSKITQISCGRLSKPVLTNYADCEMSPECGKNYSGDELIQKENEELNMGCFPTTKDNRSKSVKRKRDDSDILDEPQKLCKYSIPSNISATSSEETSNPVAPSSQNFTKNKSNKFQGNSTKKRCNCNCCEYQSNKSGHLRRHERTHTGEKPYKCECCSFSTSQHIDLKRRKCTHTGEKPYKCKHCSYSATRSTYLLRHERSHTGEKPHKCEYCSYSATKISDLRCHERTHAGQKPYKCGHCSYRAAQLGNLRQHERIHTGEKPFKCEHCDYSATQLTHLRQHERTHTGDKPYKCQYCNYSAAQLSSLQTHERTHTGEKSYQ